MAKSKEITVPMALAVKMELFKRGCFGNSDWLVKSNVEAGEGFADLD